MEGQLKRGWMQVTGKETTVKEGERDSTQKKKGRD